MALGIFGSFAVAYFLFGLDGWGPAAANESPIGQASRWCERVASGWIREPVNTLGNLGFVLAGITMFWTLTRDDRLSRARPNAFIGPTAIAVLYGVASLLLGPGSMAMHGTHTFVGAWLDNTSMVAFILIPWLYNLSRLGRWNNRALFSTYAVLLIGYAFGYWFNGPDLGIGLDLFGLSIALWVISETLYRFPDIRWWSGLVGFGVAAVFGILPTDMVSAPSEFWWVALFWVPALLFRHAPDGVRRYPWFFVGMAAFGVAYAGWLTGTADSAQCDPDSLLQAHAGWHLLSALATWAFFLFFRTERRRVVDVPAGAGLV